MPNEVGASDNQGWDYINFTTCLMISKEDKYEWEIKPIILVNFYTLSLPRIISKTFKNASYFDPLKRHRCYE